MNQKGYILISSLILLPTLLLLVYCSFWILWIVGKKNQIQNNCYQASLLSQQKLVAANEAIMALNPQALQLIKLKKKIQQTIRQAPSPKAKALALAALQGVIIKQKALAVRQQTLFSHGAEASKFHLGAFPSQLKAVVRHANPFFDSAARKAPQHQMEWRPSALKVDLPDIAPTYQRPIGYPELQLHRLAWQIPVQGLTPGWLLNFLKLKPYWEGECSSNPQMHRGRWIAGVGGASHLLR